MIKFIFILKWCERLWSQCHHLDSFPYNHLIKLFLPFGIQGTWKQSDEGLCHCYHTEAWRTKKSLSPFWCNKFQHPLLWLNRENLTYFTTWQQIIFKISRGSWVISKLISHQIAYFIHNNSCLQLHASLVSAPLYYFLPCLKRKQFFCSFCSFFTC